MLRELYKLIYEWNNYMNVLTVWRFWPSSETIRWHLFSSSLHVIPNAKFTLHDFSPIFHSPTDFDKSPTNARDRRQIGARSREWQLRSVNYQRCNLRESPRRRRRPWNIWHAKYLELSAILNPAVWMSSDRFLTEKYIGDDLQPMREQDTGQLEVRGGLFFFFFFFFFTKPALEYTEQVG